MAVDIKFNIEADVKKASEAISSFTSQATSAFDSLKIAAVAFAGIFAGNKIVQLATEQQNAINDLNFALQATGNFSAQASEGLQQFAEQLQATSQFDNVAILQTEALLESLTGLNEGGLKKATQAIADLASVTGKDLNSATQIVIRALEGQTGSLKKLGIEVKAGKNNVENFNNVIAALGNFQGAAEAKTKSFSGALNQLKNTFEDQLKIFGNLIINNKAVIEGIKFLNDGLKEFGDILKNNQSSITAFITSGITALADSIVFLIKHFKDLLSVLTTLAIFIGAIKFSALISSIGIVVDGIVIMVAQFGLLNLALGALKVAIGLTPLGLLSLGLGLIITNADKVAQSLQSATRAAVEFLGIKPPPIDDFIKKLEDQGKTAGQNISEAINEKLSANKLKIKTDIDLALKIDPNALEDAQNKIKDLIASFKPDTKITNDAKKSLKTIRDQYESGLISSEQFAEASVLIEKDKQEKLAKISTDAFIAGASDLGKGIVNLFKNDVLPPIRTIFGDIGSNLQKSLSVGLAVAQNVTRGAEGAKKAIGDAVGAVVEIFAEIPGIGSIISSIIQVLEEGPDTVKKTLSDFNAAIPGLLSNIIHGIIAGVKQSLIDSFKNIGTFIRDIVKEIVPLLLDELPDLLHSVSQAFLEAIPDIVNALAEAAPVIIQALIDHLPEFVEATIKSIPTILEALGKALLNLQLIVVKIWSAIFTSNLGKAAINFVKDIVAGAGKFVEEILKKISGASLFGGSGGGSGGGFDVGNAIIGAVVAGPIGAVAGFFAEGGQVPSGFPNDSFPARLTSGEFVIDRSQNKRLDQFLNEQAASDARYNSILEQLSDIRKNNSDASQNLSLNLNVGEQQLASAILNLSRRGFRTS